MTSLPLKVALIGLGNQSVSNHLPAILQTPDISLCAVCDSDQSAVERVTQMCHVPGFLGVEDLLANIKPDFAIMAVPHNAYAPNISLLAHAGVHILKEKPFAMSITEALTIHNLIEETGIITMILLVRRFHPIFRSVASYLRRIGSIHTIIGQYTLNIERLDQGWRSNRTSSGGGAVLDMGYHTIDLLIWYFGLPSRIAARIGSFGRDNQSYDVEDTATILFSYDRPPTTCPIAGTLTISRAFPEKDEKLMIVGSRGTIIVKRSSMIWLQTDGSEIESLSRNGSWLSANIDHIEFFCNAVRDRRRAEQPLYLSHFEHMAFIDAIYISASTDQYVSPATLLPAFMRQEHELHRRASPSG